MYLRKRIVIVLFVGIFLGLNFTLSIIFPEYGKKLRNVLAGKNIEQQSLSTPSLLEEKETAMYSVFADLHLFRSEKSDFADMFVSTDIEYTTLGSNVLPIRVYVFEKDYDTIHTYFAEKSAAAQKSIQDVNNFFGKSLYLNNINGDQRNVYIITKIQDTTVGFEIQKDAYQKAKNYLNSIRIPKK